MLWLRLTEDSLHYNLLFFLFNFEFALLFLKAIFILMLTFAEKHLSQFTLLPLIVVRGDLVKPQTNILIISFLLLCFGHVLLSNLIQFLLKLIFRCTPLGSLSFVVFVVLLVAILVSVLTVIIKVVRGISVLWLVFIPSALTMLVFLSLTARLRHRCI